MKKDRLLEKLNEYYLQHGLKVRKDVNGNYYTISTKFNQI